MQHNASSAKLFKPAALTEADNTTHDLTSDEFRRLNSLIDKLNLIPNADDSIEITRKIHFSVISRLVWALREFKQHVLLDENNTLNVLSLGCGKTIAEYLALKIIFPSINISFIAIDIDENSIMQARKIFHNFSHELVFLKADATNISELEKTLQLLKRRPTKGFSLIALRQPEILGHNPSVFIDMINRTVPFFSAVQGRLLTSCYYAEEFAKVAELLEPPVYFTLPKNYIFPKAGTEVTLTEGKFLPDQFMTIVGCTGFNYNHTLLVERPSIFETTCKKLRQIIEKSCKNETLLKPLEAGDIELLLRRICANFQVIPNVMEILKFMFCERSNLKLNINATSPSTGKTALELLCENTKVSDQDKSLFKAIFNEANKLDAGHKIQKDRSIDKKPSAGPGL